MRSSAWLRRPGCRGSASGTRDFGQVSDAEVIAALARAEATIVAA